MVETVEGAGVALRVTIEGDGAPVLLLHGIAADAERWAELLSRPPSGVRLIAPDRRGYGGSGIPEPYERTTVEEQAEDAVAVLRAFVDGPAVVVGDGLGALVALDLARRYRDRVKALILLEAPMFALVPDANEALAAERELIEIALRDAGPGAGVRALLAADGRADVPWIDRVAAIPRVVFADVAGPATWPATRRELRALDLPVALAVRADARPHVRAATAALTELLPQASPCGVDDIETVIEGAVA